MNLTCPNTLSLFLCAVLIAAAVTDLRHRRIPNLYTFSAAGVALAAHALAGGWGGLLFSLAGLGLGMALLLPMYAARGMGAGDVKLLGAVGAALGPLGVFNAFLFSALAGLAYLGILLAAHGRYSRRVLARVAGMSHGLLRSGFFIYVPSSDEERSLKPKLCYGVAIAAGTLFVLGWNQWTQQFPVLG